MSLNDELYQLVRAAVRDELAERSSGIAPEPELMRLPEASKAFGVSVSWLEARSAAGELALHGRGRMRRVRPADVRALLKRRGPVAATPSARAENILRGLPGGRAK